MDTAPHPIDMTKVHTVIYHLPDGQKIAYQLDEIEQFVDLSFGKICDTSEVNGVIHFFPRGHA